MDACRLEGKSVLITGARGLIGSCLTDLLLRKGCRVFAVGRDIDTLSKRFVYCKSTERLHFLRQDLCEPLTDLPERIDYIIHAAGNSDPAHFVKKPVETLLSNVAGTNALLAYGVHHGMRRFLYVSSGEVYGESVEGLDAFTEEYCGPLDYSSFRTCYPAGKRAGETLCQSYIHEYGADAVIVRPCHIFGPTMLQDDSHAVAQFLRSAAEGRDIVLKSTGMMERSHCYVLDAALAILRVLTDGKNGTAYNIADENYQLTVRAFAERCAAAGGCSLCFDLPQAQEAKGYTKVSRMVLDAKRLRGIGWTPMDGEDKIQSTVHILTKA